MFHPQTVECEGKLVVDDGKLVVVVVAILVSFSVGVICATGCVSVEPETPFPAGLSLRSSVSAIAEKII